MAYYLGRNGPGSRAAPRGMKRALWGFLLICGLAVSESAASDLGLNTNQDDVSDPVTQQVWHVSSKAGVSCPEQLSSLSCHRLQDLLTAMQDGGIVKLTPSDDQTAFLGCTDWAFNTSGKLQLIGQGLRPLFGCLGSPGERSMVTFAPREPGNATLVLRNIFFKNVDVVLNAVNLELEDCEFENSNLHLKNKGSFSTWARIRHGTWRGHVDCQHEDSCQPSSGILVMGNVTTLHVSHAEFFQHRINISLASDAEIVFDDVRVSNSPALMPTMGGIFVALSRTANYTTFALRNSVLENQYNWHPAASVMNLFMSALLVRLLGQARPGHSLPSNNVQVLVDNCTFLNNERGLTFQGPLENITVVNSVFDSNVAMHAGGALLLLTQPRKIILLRNCTFNNNAAGHMRSSHVKPGGDYFTMMGDEVRVDSNCCKGAITLVGKGGAARIQRGTIILEHCSFFNNTARVLGGTVFVDRDGELIIRNSVFLNSPDHERASQQGDIIYSNGKVRMNGGHLLVQSSSNHISLLQHSGDHWSIAVYDVTIECPIGHRLRVMNTSAYKIQAEQGLQRSYMLDQLSYFCESCPRHKYSMDRGLLNYKLDQGVFAYFTLMINGENPDTTFDGEYNYHDIQCKDCPYGGNCDITLRAIPNFWGYDRSGNITFQLCPKGYCCANSPCASFNACATSRTGVLCGRCAEGYSEALFSAKCVLNETCGPMWIWLFSIGTGILYALLLLFQKDIRDFIFTKPGLNETRLQRWTSCCRRGRTRRRSGAGDEQQRADGEGLQDLSMLNVSLTDSEANKEAEDTVGVKPIEMEVKICNGTAKDRDEGDDPTEQAEAPKTLAPQPVPTDIGAILLIIVLYYFQDAMLFQVKTVFAEQETKTRSTLRAILLGLFKFQLEVAHFVDNVCLMPGLSASMKLLALTVLVPYVLLLFGFIHIIYLIRMSAGRRYGSSDASGLVTTNTFVCRLSTGFMLALLFMYQRLAKTAFTLLNCVPVGDHNVLFIEGSVQCYQMWQYGVMAYALGSIVPFCAVLLLGPGLLREGKVGLPAFFTACLVPLPFVLHWICLRLCQRKNKRKTRQESFPMSPPCEAVVKVLQGPFKDLNNKYVGPVCWAGVLVFRRLILILLYTFINNSLVRVVSMLMTCFLILLHHVHVQPYKDNFVNVAGSASVSALMIVGGINLVRAGFETSEYIPQGPNERLIQVMQETESVLMLWFPLVIMSMIWCALLVKIILSVCKRV